MNHLGYYYFNPEDGRVYSSVVKERMRVYGKGSDVVIKTENLTKVFRSASGEECCCP